MHLTHDSLHNRRFLLPSSHAQRSCRAWRKMPRSSLLAHKAPVMQAKPMILRVEPAPLPATLHLIRWSGPCTSETSPQVMFVTLTMSFLPLFYNRTHIPGYVGLLLLLLLFLLRCRLADVLSNMVALISCSMTWTVWIVWLAKISVKNVALYWS